MRRTLVIAEPGCTAEGDCISYLDLIDVAKQAGADCWKPQWTSDPVRMCERRHIGSDHPGRAYYERAYRWLAFPPKLHADFKAACLLVGLQYAVSVFLPEDCAVVAPYVDYLKISSFEAGDTELLEAAIKAVGSHRVIISTGMGQTAPCVHHTAFSPGTINILHCVSAYPAPIEALHLSLLRYQPYAGLSDHSRNLITGAVAVGAGARIIETHYRLDRCDPANPDYAVALTPAEFAVYVHYIREAESLVGEAVKAMQPCELEMAPYRVRV